MTEDTEYQAPTTAQIIDAVRAKHNDICISTVYDDLGRIVGVHFDDMDIYHIVDYPSREGQPARRRYETMVGACDSLNGIYRGHDYLDASFTRRDCPPQDDFIVTADSRDDFVAVSGEHGAAHYDEVIAPALAANAPDVAPRSPWQIRQAQIVEALEAFAAHHPEYADTVAGLHWMGFEDGIDTYHNFSGGRLAATFERSSGIVRGPTWDPRTHESTPWGEGPYLVLSNYQPARPAAES